MGWPSDQEYKIYLLLNQINHHKPTVDSINSGAAIYGPSISNPTGQNHSKATSIMCTGLSITHTITCPTETPNKQHQHQFLIFQGTIIPTHEVPCLIIPLSQISSAIKQYINKFGVRGIAITFVHADNDFKKQR